MDQDNNTLVQNDSNVVVSNTVLPAAPTVSATVSPVQQSQNTTVYQKITSSDVLICAKCGSEMKRDARYCMKCGNLNYLHPDNESMKQYAWQNIKEGHYISGANVENEQPLTMKSSDSISDIHPYRTCCITNIVLHLLMALAMIFVLNSSGESVSVIYMVITIIGVAVSFILNYSTQVLYIKAGEPWWGYFVPVYNNYLLYKIAFGNGWMILTLLVPVLGEVFAFVLLYNLGKKFYKNGILTIFFPYVMIPMIAFDKNSEYSMLAKAVKEENEVSVSGGKTDSEKAYGRKKFFITLLVSIVVVVILYFVWPYLAPIVEKIYNVVMEKIQSFN